MASSSARHHKGVEDRISDLSDDVLCHILSFCHTKHAAQTSVLSKRWKTLWIGALSNIDIDFHKRDRKKFMAVVDRVLSLRESSDIRKFRLEYNCRWISLEDEDLSPIDRWLCIAAESIVQLDLRLNGLYSEWKFPPSILTSKTLVALKVDSEFTNYDTSLESICFPSLKLLSVKSDAYESESLLVSMMILLSTNTCPVLEDLTLDGWMELSLRGDHNEFRINAPELKTLSTCLYLQYRQRRCSVDINAPKLQNFYVKINYDSKAPNYSFENPKSLVKFTIDSPNLGLDCDRYMTTLLSSISHVEELIVTAPYVRYMTTLLTSFSNAAFNNLKQLKISEVYNWNFLMELLQRSPNLAQLVLELNKAKWDEANLQSSPPASAPSCLSAHLEEITILGFSGHLDEMELAKYLLKFGSILSVATISVGPKLRVPREKIHKELSMLECGSKTCHVEIEDSTPLPKREDTQRTLPAMLKLKILS